MLYHAGLSPAAKAEYLHFCVASVPKTHHSSCLNHASGPRARTDVLAELGHEGLAEAHNLIVGLALGVKVAAALAAAHRQRGQAVLQDLRIT